MPKTDPIEIDKRVRQVMEWLIEDFPYDDIVTQIVVKWGVCDRQAKRYIATARDRWGKAEQGLIDQKRRLKIASLKKLKRSLKDSHKGTPGGIRAILQVEREIIKLEGLNPAIEAGTHRKGWRTDSNEERQCEYDSRGSQGHC